MTVEQIDAKIKELSELKKTKKKQEKVRLQKQKALETARKRKHENRVKYIIGGYYLKVFENKELCAKFLNGTAGKLREQDLKTLNDYFKN